MPIAKQRSRTLVQRLAGILAAGGLVVFGLAPGALADAEPNAGAPPAAELEALPAGLAAMSVTSAAGAPGVVAAPAYMSPLLKRMLSQSSDGLAVVERKSGRLSLHLQGRFLRAVFATIDENGRVVTSCHGEALPPAVAPADGEGKE
jgi:hypothetical protein